MTRELTLRRDNLLLCLALSLGVTAALFWYQGNKGFSLWDEGYLWYGVQRVLLGEVPIRDFMAYDPGRYYWSAWIMQLFLRNDILSLRIAVAAFQALGLFCALLLIAPGKTGRQPLFLLFSALLLVLWMFPYYKVFDTTLSILLVANLAYLIQNPNRTGFFVSGICLGLIAIFGRNHGVYGIAASLGVMAWLGCRRQAGLPVGKGIFLWGGGVVLGFAPLLLMALFIPGFAAAFWESIRFLLEIGATNLPRPVPWPWLTDFAGQSPAKALREFLTGLGFVGLLVFGVWALGFSFWQRLRGRSVAPALVAAAFLALPYAHYAFSRADIHHLAMGIFPLLIGVLVLVAPGKPLTRWSLVLTLCVASFVMTRDQNLWLKYRSIQKWVPVEISGNTLKVDQATADDIRMLRELTEKYAPRGENVLVLPFWPGAYALLERKSPTWEIYALFRHPATFEQSEIERIKQADPRFVFILDLPLDGRDDLRYQNSHPLTYRYITDHFTAVPDPLKPGYKVLTAAAPDR